MKYYNRGVLIAVLIYTPITVLGATGRYDKAAFVFVGLVLSAAAGWLERHYIAPKGGKE